LRLLFFFFNSLSFFFSMARRDSYWQSDECYLTHARITCECVTGRVVGTRRCHSDAAVSDQSPSGFDQFGATERDWGAVLCMLLFDSFHHFSSLREFLILFLRYFAYSFEFVWYLFDSFRRYSIFLRIFVLLCLLIASSSEETCLILFRCYSTFFENFCSTLFACSFEFDWYVWVCFHSFSYQGVLCEWSVLWRDERTAVFPPGTFENTTTVSI
jgi:hypothetical protein